MYHSIYEDSGSRRSCSCGEQFTNALAALDHALPLNTRDLAEAVAADPKSSPELRTRAEQTAQEAAAIRDRPRGKD